MQYLTVKELREIRPKITAQQLRRHKAIRSIKAEKVKDDLYCLEDFEKFYNAFDAISKDKYYEEINGEKYYPACTLSRMYNLTASTITNIIRTENNSYLKSFHRRYIFIKEKDVQEYVKTRGRKYNELNPYSEVVAQDAIKNYLKTKTKSKVHFYKILPLLLSKIRISHVILRYDIDCLNQQQYFGFPAGILIPCVK